MNIWRNHEDNWLIRSLCCPKKALIIFVLFIFFLSKWSLLLTSLGQTNGSVKPNNLRGKCISIKIMLTFFHKQTVNYFSGVKCDFRIEIFIRGIKTSCEIYLYFYVILPSAFCKLYLMLVKPVMFTANTLSST